MLDQLTDADLARWVWTPVRYGLLAVAVLMASALARQGAEEYVRGEGCPGPRLRDGWMSATLATVVVWVGGVVAGLLWPVFYTESGPVYHRLLAGVCATFLGGWWGFLEGRIAWRKGG